MRPESITLTESNGLIQLSLEGKLILAYANDGNARLNGKNISLSEYGFQGVLGLDEDFFYKFRIQNSGDTGSEMQNIAKAFFITKHDKNKVNNVCLVQYLHPNGHSGYHYHTLPEYIIQIAGKSKVRLKNQESLVEELTDMNPGKILFVPPFFAHQVITDSLGSITVPIKPLKRGIRDHLYDVK